MQTTYEEAISQLEEIVRQMETNELDVDQMNERLKTAQQLIKLCREKLIKTDEEIKQTLSNDSK
ncbi:MAG: exodeoxyribonuclease VII small subunit [Prevotella sp.]|nr:exodeoxyribonuclease VII small subunit [Prevotella sp.]MCI5854422.1 exodeoxyribonuclease VII small subunit [Prevotella sp.]MDD6737111.1 exodeoxyribonuclease VII small subunit [Prevotella sp.]MDY6092648.1 exodeoxyribonuclease VII small subunit [Prevotella sp.]